MILFSCHHMQLSFGADVILEDVNFAVNEKDRIGIIGSNGAGKSTLIKTLLGLYQPSEGTVFRSAAAAAYLPQNSGLNSGRSVMDEFLQPYTALLDLEQKIADLEQRLASGGEAEDVMKLSQRLSACYETYNMQGGNTYRSRIANILRGLGFAEETWPLTVNCLSGGQRTRLALGRLLLSEPQVMILDEPTNHLDTASIEWLENELQAYKGTLLVISHDRHFLDAVTEKTLLVEYGHVQLYPAPYSKYIPLRDADLLYQERCYQQQQKEIARIQAFIEKQRQWNRERNIIAAESRMKWLEKMTIVEKPKGPQQPPAIRFTVEKPGGKEVLKVKDLSFSFPERTLFSGLSFEIRKGERIFLQGPNGCGKSTLLKIITGMLPPDSGAAVIGAQTTWSYYAQDLSDLNEDHTVFDEIWEHANRGRSAVSYVTPGQIRSALAAFGLQGDDVFKKIAVLSGGEKARVSLLKIIYNKSAFLILDEPTNHLDIKTREILESALREFEGTLLVVSHDRYFVQQLASRCIDLSVFCQTTQQTAEKNTDRTAQYKKEKESRARQRKLGADRRKLEAAVAEVESRLAAVEEALNQPENAADYQKISSLYEEQNQLTQQWNALTDRLALIWDSEEA